MNTKEAEAFIGKPVKKITGRPFHSGEMTAFVLDVWGFPNTGLSFVFEDGTYISVNNCELVLKNINRLMKEVEAIGKTSWLVFNVVQSNFDPYRDEKGRPMNMGFAPIEFVEKPMDRMMIQVDGFTQIDFEVLDTNRLRVIYNGFQNRSGAAGFYEDRAFQRVDYMANCIVTWDDLKERVNEWAWYSNNCPGLPWARKNPAQGG